MVILFFLLRSGFAMCHQNNFSFTDRATCGDEAKQICFSSEAERYRPYKQNKRNLFILPR